MKKLLIGLGCFVFGVGISLAQNEKLDKLPAELNEKFTVKTVKYMAVFPGCEETDINDKEMLMQCFSQKLSALLSDRLSNFAKEMDKKGEVLANAKIAFVVNKEGKIIEIEALPEGSPSLKKAASEAMEKIAKKIDKIQPAAIEDGTPVNLLFQIPVRYFVQGESQLNKIPWNEYVVATIFDENHKYELRHDKKFVFKIYDVTNGQNSFIQDFKMLEEAYTTEPYASLLKNQSEKLMLAEKKVGDIFYRIYYNSKNSHRVDVYKMIGDQEVYLDTFNKADIQYISEYLKVVLR